MSQSRKIKLSQSQTQQQEEDLTIEIVQAAVKAILTLDHKKRPIKQSDILHCLNAKLRRKQHQQLWEQVMEQLKGLGMTLAECVGTQAKSFLLIAENPPEKFMHEYAAKEEKADRTLLILILAYIFMKEGVVTEYDLFHHLSLLNILTNSSNVHEYFGDVKSKINGQFVEQMYLTRTVVADQDVTELRWGQRAKLEVPLLSVLEFVCKVGYENKMEPKHWVSQYGRIVNEIEASN